MSQLRRCSLQHTNRLAPRVRQSHSMFLLGMEGRQKNLWRDSLDCRSQDRKRLASQSQRHNNNQVCICYLPLPQEHRQWVLLWMPSPSSSNQLYRRRLGLEVLVLCRPFLGGMEPDARTQLGKNSLLDIGHPSVSL